MYRIGHRGACGYEPENTLRSFAKALDLGVDVVHFDALVCRTGEVVICRDDSVARTAGTSGDVAEMSFADLSRLDVGKGERIPTLQQVLDFISGRATVYIELHGTDVVAPVAKVIGHYVQEHGWRHDQFTVSALDYRHLLEHRKLLPQVSTFAVAASAPTDWARYATDAGAQGVCLWHESVDDAYVADVRERKLQLYTWTVNTKEDIDRMMRHGVDGIVSDFPDRI